MALVQVDIVRDGQSWLVSFGQGSDDLSQMMGEIAEMIVHDSFASFDSGESGDIRCATRC